MQHDTHPARPHRVAQRHRAAVEAALRNLASITFATDNVFSDGTDLEMTTMQANSGGGYSASITISIAV